MTPLKAKDLRTETTEELQGKVSALRKELYGFRVQAHSGQIEKSHRIRQIKRDLARLLSVLKEKENVQK